MAKLTVRRLNAGDNDLAEIAKCLNSDEWQDFGHLEADFTEDSLKKFLEEDSRIYLVGYLDGKIAGAVHGYVLQHPAGPKYIYVDEVDTAIPHRRMGVASAMMREMFKIGRQYSVDEVWLGTEHDNEPAKALYESLDPHEVEYGPIYSYKIKRS